MTQLEMLNAFWDWVDSRGVVRRLVLFLTLGLTAHSYWWAVHFVSTTDKTGTEVGLMVAAVTAPISYLQKAVFEAYIASRRKRAND